MTAVAIAALAPTPVSGLGLPLFPELLEPFSLLEELEEVSELLGSMPSTTVEPVFDLLVGDHEAAQGVGFKNQGLILFHKGSHSFVSLPFR